jgi:hypothetical protein
MAGARRASHRARPRLKAQRDHEAHSGWARSGDAAATGGKNAPIDGPNCRAATLQVGIDLYIVYPSVPLI